MTIPRAEALAMLAWQVELGADEAIGEAPVDRYAAAVSAAATAPAAPPAVAAPAVVASDADPVRVAEAAAAAAADLDALGGGDRRVPALRAAERGAQHRLLRRPPLGAGDDRRRGAGARGGRAGPALRRRRGAAARPDVRGDRAVGLEDDPDRGLYITNVSPWRPPQNRDPSPDEIAMLMPFVRRHVELADPEVLVCMGNISCGALLGRRGVTRLRGNWTEALGRPVLPMLHPAYLLRTPAAKREAWADLLSLQARLER